MPIELQRAYEDPRDAPGKRVLVDRVWPRGRARDALDLESWRPDLGPSTELRQWFGHDPERWEEFRERYRAELDEASGYEDLVADLRADRTVVLVYGAKDTEHNQAVVLREWLLER